MLFANSYKYSLSCDLSDHAVKIVQLQKIRGSLKIISLGYTELKPGIIMNGVIKQPDDLVLAIKKQLPKIQGEKIQTEEVTVNAPSLQTFIKTIGINRDPDTTIEKQIQNELDKHFPFSREEGYFDWQIGNKLNNKQTFTIAAISRQVADAYINLVKNLGWQIAALEVEALATARALLGLNLATNTMIIDLGHVHSEVIVVANKTIQFTISLPISGQNIDTLISQKLKLSGEQAKKAKITCGLDEKKCQGALKILLDSFLDEITYKIEDAISYYEQTSPLYQEIDQIILTGGGANLLKISDVLSLKLKKEVKIGDPLASLNKTLNKKIDLLTRKSPLIFSTAIGLALRNKTV